MALQTKPGSEADCGLWNSNPADSHAILAGMGTHPRLRIWSAAGTPATRPIAEIEVDRRLSHVIHYRDESSGKREGIPLNVMGVEIWVKIDDSAPSRPEELTMLALDTGTPYRAEFPEECIGKRAYYALRWTNDQGEKGPWSQIVGAPIFG